MFVCHRAVVILSLALAAGSMWPASAARAGCSFSGASVVDMGYRGAAGALTQVDPVTGRSYPANLGITTRTLGECVARCESDINCRAITFRRGPRYVRNCLIFTGYDVPTRRELRLRVHMMTQHISLIIRSRFRGPSCKAGSGDALGGDSTDDIPVLD